MSIIGTILGDIAGSKWEFENCTSSWHDCELFCDDSVYTDDTVLTIAIGVAAITDLKYERWLRYFGEKYYYVGFGMRFQDWLNEKKKISQDSWGNGSAMRVSKIIKGFPEIEEPLLFVKGAL